MTIDTRVVTGPAETGILNELEKQVISSLSRLGILFRVFSRVKDSNSIREKLAEKKQSYTENSKKMQDLFGIRVALYFSDDSEIAQKAVQKVFDLDSTSITLPTDGVFGPIRCNLVFRVPENLAKKSLVLQSHPLIDSTFETQFRTVFSEGWHEIEHDLRYKRKEDWDNLDDLSRTLNGLMATLETCDWMSIKIFEDMAFRKYSDNSVLAFIHAKFRLKIQKSDIQNSILMRTINEDHQLRKLIFKISRKEFLEKMLEKSIDIPLTSENIIYLCNRFFINSPKIHGCEPRYLRDIFDA